MEEFRYSEEEIRYDFADILIKLNISSAIRTIFNGFDGNKIGRVHINQLPVFLSKIGKSDGIL